jgi:hypothetical protein
VNEIVDAPKMVLVSVNGDERPKRRVKESLRAADLVSGNACGRQRVHRAVRVAARRGAEADAELSVWSIIRAAAIMEAMGEVIFWLEVMDARSGVIGYLLLLRPKTNSISWCAIHVRASKL